MYQDQRPMPPSRCRSVGKLPASSMACCYFQLCRSTHWENLSQRTGMCDETMSSGLWRSSSKIHTVGAVADVSRSGPVPLPTPLALRTFRSSGVFAAAVGWDSSGRSNSQRENFGEQMLMRRCSSAAVLLHVGPSCGILSRGFLALLFLTTNVSSLSMSVEYTVYSKLRLARRIMQSTMMRTSMRPTKVLAVLSCSPSLLRTMMAELAD